MVSKEKSVLGVSMKKEEGNDRESPLYISPVAWTLEETQTIKEFSIA